LTYVHLQRMSYLECFLPCREEARLYEARQSLGELELEE